MLSRIALAAAAAAGLALAGCAPMNGAYAPGAQQMGAFRRVRYATVENVARERVRVRSGDSGIATVGGAIGGGVLGSMVGGGNGRTVATMAGVLLGGALGNAMAKNGNTVPAIRLTLRLADGQSVSILQAARGSARFYPGEAVEVTGSARSLRVQPR